MDRVRRRVAHILEHRGLGLRTDADEDTLRRDEPLLAELYGASLLGSITTGPRAGWRAAKAGDAVVDADALPSGRCCASVAGFSVHAGVCIRAHDRMQQGHGRPLFCAEAQLVPKLRSLIDACPGFIIDQISLALNFIYGTVCTMTKRSDIFPRVRQPLTDLENEIMHIIWRRGPSSVEAVYEALIPARKLKESSVRTMLRRLEKKGHLSHASDGRAYIYKAAEEPGRIAARAVRQIIDRFCQGSVAELVTGMVDANVLTEEELDQLARLARKHRKGGL